jgi:hypothetical protein
VDNFGEHYLMRSRNGGGVNTQTAIDLNAIPGTVARINHLSSMILNTYGSGHVTELAVERARRRAQRFRDGDYLDLRQLMGLLSQEYDGTSRIKDVSEELVRHLEVKSADGPIVANFHGLSREYAHGLSIYFPFHDCSSFYGRQAFADSGWDAVIRRANGMGASDLSIRD